MFLSVGVVDSGDFKGEHAVEELRRRTEQMLSVCRLARRLKVPATARMAIGTEVVAEAERLCLETAREFPHIVFFAGKMIFQRERWYHRLLHNETHSPSRSDCGGGARPWSLYRLESSRQDEAALRSNGAGVAARGSLSPSRLVPVFLLSCGQWSGELAGVATMAAEI